MVSKKTLITFGKKEKKTIEKFQIKKNGLKVTNPASIKFSDIHRLPQHPIKKNRRSVTDQSLLSCKQCLIKI